MPFGPCIAIVVLCGAVSGAMSQIPAPQALAVALGAASLIPVCHRRWMWQSAVLIASCAIAVAHAASARDRALAPDLPSAAVVTAGQPVLLTGRLTGDAEPTSSGGARVEVDAFELADGLGRHRVRLQVQAYVAGTMVDAARSQWLRGRTVQVPVTLREPQTFRNPGARSEHWQALLRGYHLTGTVKSAMLVTVQPGPWAEERAASLREYVRRAARRMCGSGRPEAAAIVIAILIGDRAGLDPGIERRLQIAGTYHVMAISGGNVALVAGLVLVGLRPLTRSFRLPALLTIGAVLGYGWVIGPQPSVSRAVTAACVYLAAQCAGLIVSSRHVLALVAIVVTALDPLTPVLPGAWLSFGATFGILIFASALLDWLRARRATNSGSWPDIVRMVASLFCATAAAELMLWPVGALLFSRVGVAGLVLNFIAIPAMAVVQVSGGIGVALVDWWPLAGSVAGTLASWAATLLVRSSALVDLAPWLSWRVPAPSPVWLIGYYAGVGLVWWGWRQPAVRKGGAWLAMGCLAGILAAPTLAWRRPAAPWLRMTMVDVGQGDALVLQLPGGRSLLVDAGGSASPFDIGDRVVAPTLWALGVRRLDWLAVTHPDLDHIGGSASVAATFDPIEIWEGVPVPRDLRRAALHDVATTRRLAWRQARRDDRIDVGAVTVDVLNPRAPDWERQ